MPKVIKLRKGLDIRLAGEAGREVVQLPVAKRYAVRPDDFPRVTPKLLVSAGDTVQAGSPLFFDKSRPEILFTSPVSGTVASIDRGEKRKILAITIDADAGQSYVEFGVPDLQTATRKEIAELLLASGLWPSIIRRPYGIIANPDEEPKAIFVSGFDSAPLAPDMDFVLAGERENLQAGISALAKLTPGKVRLSLRKGREDVLAGLQEVEYHVFDGPHPAGNVGVQIHRIDPIAKGDIVWTVDIQSVALIGRLMRRGRVDMTRTVALTGSEVIEPKYYSLIAGAPLQTIAPENRIQTQPDDGEVRIIDGNVLTGRKADADGYVGFYTNQITVIPEGDHYELVGWIMPRLHRFSVSRAYFSWLMPCKRYALDTNLNGGERAFVVTGLYERYLPMDIYPMYLLKAILAGDIDKMENLGIYEVIAEDFALCEFVDPSKTEMQQIIRGGIDLMIKEL